jgi:hypothetical protein
VYVGPARLRAGDLEGRRLVGLPRGLPVAALSSTGDVPGEAPGEVEVAPLSSSRGFVRFDKGTMLTPADLNAIMSGSGSAID